MSFILRFVKNYYFNFFIVQIVYLIVRNFDEEEVDEEFNENVILDFEERKRKVDFVDELIFGEQEEDDYIIER